MASTLSRSTAAVAFFFDPLPSVEDSEDSEWTEFDPYTALSESMGDSVHFRSGSSNISDGDDVGSVSSSGKQEDVCTLLEMPVCFDSLDTVVAVVEDLTLRSSATISFFPSSVVHSSVVVLAPVGTASMLGRVVQ